jgi:hypothetical protein
VSDQSAELIAAPLRAKSRAEEEAGDGKEAGGADRGCDQGNQ